MKRTFILASLILALTSALSGASAASFIYHGVLQDAGRPADGKYDIELTLYASQDTRNVVGGPLTIYGVNVTEGTFSTEADFGPLAKSFTNAFVGVKVRHVGDVDFTSLGSSPALADTNSSCPGSWSLDGNAGNPLGTYLGNADAQDLRLEAGGLTGVLVSGSVPDAVALNNSLIDATSGTHSLAVVDAYQAKGAYSFAGDFPEERITVARSSGAIT